MPGPAEVVGDAVRERERADDFGVTREAVFMKSWFLTEPLGKITSGPFPFPCGLRYPKDVSSLQRMIYRQRAMYSQQKSPELLSGRSLIRASGSLWETAAEYTGFDS